MSKQERGGRLKHDVCWWLEVGKERKEEARHWVRACCNRGGFISA